MTNVEDKLYELYKRKEYLYKQCSYHKLREKYSISQLFRMGVTQPNVGRTLTPNECINQRNEIDAEIASWRTLL